MKFIVFIGAVFGWGSIGHRLIGECVDLMLKNTTKKNLKRWISNVSSVSTWADEQRMRMHWTAPLHYAGMNDNPPETCAIWYKSCSEPGVICAIQEIFSGLNSALNQPSFSIKKASGINVFGHDLSISNATKFLIHFIQDIHQPLHLTSRDRGGNTKYVIFGRKNLSLHELWDSWMLEHMNLNTTILKNLNKSDVDLWNSCPLNLESIICPDSWAIKVNSLNCEFVWQNLSSNLNGSYFENAKIILIRQILKATIRLTNALEIIFK